MSSDWPRNILGNINKAVRSPAYRRPLVAFGVFIVGCLLILRYRSFNITAHARRTFNFPSMFALNLLSIRPWVI